MRALPVAVVCVGVFLTPWVAGATPRTSLVSDGFFVGMREGPGAALTFAWDLDVYVTRNRAVSLGPGASLSVLGTTPNPGGGDQELLLAADVLRLKVGLNEPGGIWRPYAVLGAGLTYAQLPEQYSSGVTVVPAMAHAGTRTAGDAYYPAMHEFAPMLTLGVGGDLFTGGPLAVTALLQSRVHLAGTDRIPDVWLELLVGIRFGI